MNKLQTKLRDNLLRKKRTELLNLASTHLRFKLENSEFLLSEASQRLLESWYWPSPIIDEESQPFESSQFRPATWQYFDFDNTDALNRQIGLLKFPQQASYCWLDADAPIMKINGGLWNQHAYHFIQLIQQSDNLCFAFVSEDNSRGILLSEYIGRLAINRRTNHSEVVYELVTW